MIFRPPSDDDSPNPNESLFEQKDEFLDISTERRQAAKKQARNWFLTLLTIGLILGGLLAVGVVQVLNQLGLTAKPTYQLRIERIQK